MADPLTPTPASVADRFPGWSAAPPLPAARSQVPCFTLAFRYAACKGVASAPDAGLPDFDGAVEASPWAVEAFRWAVQARLISPEARCLLPKFAADRALAETALKWFLG